VFADPLYGREQIDQYRCEVLERWTQEEPARLPELIQAYRQLLERYPQSENSAAYSEKLTELESRGAAEGP
jgi:hypothetical protein